jgi:hypothetical protein
MDRTGAVTGELHSDDVPSCGFLDAARRWGCLGIIDTSLVVSHSLSPFNCLSICT